jgi:hypothetical protein
MFRASQKEAARKYLRIDWRVGSGTQSIRPDRFVSPDDTIQREGSV